MIAVLVILATLLGVVLFTHLISGRNKRLLVNNEKVWLTCAWCTFAAAFLFSLFGLIADEPALTIPGVVFIGCYFASLSGLHGAKRYQEYYGPNSPYNEESS